jgi:hypothetical protein
MSFVGASLHCLRRFAVPAVASATLLFGATGCAKKPTMKVNHAEVTGMQIGFPPAVNVVLTIVLDVYNPNSYDVAIRAVRGQTVLAGRYTLPVDFQAAQQSPNGQGVWLRSDTLTQVRVPVVVPADLALTLLRETMTTQWVAYRFVGTADVTATRSLKIEKDGYSISENGFFARQQLEFTIAGMNIPLPH